MSRYFSRLLQRAAGVQKSPATPAVSPASAPRSVVADTADPFETQAPSDLQAPSLPPPKSPRTAEPSEPPALHEPAHSSPPPTLLAAPTVPINFDTLVPRVAATEPQAPSPLRPKQILMVQTPSLAQPDMSAEKSSPDTMLPQNIERAVEAHASERPRPRIKIEESSTPLQPPEPPPPVLITAKPLDVRPSQSPPVSPPVTQPALLNVPESSEPPFTIEPTPDKAPLPAPVAQSEPRLQIGRLSVEVVPVAPVAAPPPRAVRRTSGTSAAGVNATASLQFGLGQM